MKPKKPLKRSTKPLKRSPLKRKAKKYGKSLRYELIEGGAVREYPGARQVCQKGPAGCAVYYGRTYEMAGRQNWRCCLCGERLATYSMTFEHEAGRGVSRQDDRIEIDGKRINGASHFACNMERGSKRTPLRFQ